jgi:hypothetical protein
MLMLPPAPADMPEGRECGASRWLAAKVRLRRRELVIECRVGAGRSGSTSCVGGVRTPDVCVCVCECVRVCVCVCECV